MAASAGAITAGVRAAHRDKAANARINAHDRFVKEEIRIIGIFYRYDKNNSNKLELDQLKALLTDYNGGTAPTDTELKFVLKVADKAENDAINRDEVLYALKVWQTYVSEKDKIENVFKKYDTDSSGMLDREQLKRFLIDLNDAKEVRDQEVDWVLKRADVTADGGINKIELMAAVSAWYAHVEGADVGDADAQRKCCLIL